MAEVRIRLLDMADIPACAGILCDVYNTELWQCRWSQDTAAAYLTDYAEARRFVGFVAEMEGRVVGAAFAHGKIWWNNTELALDELFVAPAHQGQGVGRRLMEAVEAYAAQHRLAGVTLSTNRHAPAPDFYRRRGYVDCEHVLFMAWEVPDDPE